MAKINYADKVVLNVNSDIADINKTRAADMNEIKSVVNQNYDELKSNVIYDIDTLNYGYTSGLIFPTTPNNSTTITGLPDLSSYTGKILTIFVQFGNNCYSAQNIIPNTLRIQLVVGYEAATDYWMPVLRLMDVNSTSWTLYYDSSFIINTNKSITVDSGQRTFAIIRAIIS